MPSGMGRATKGAIIGALAPAVAAKVDSALGVSGGRGASTRPVAAIDGDGDGAAASGGGSTGEGAATNGLGAGAAAITGGAAATGRATSGGGDDSVGRGATGVATGICRANGGVEGSATDVAGVAGVVGSEDTRAAAGGDMTVVRTVSVRAGFKGTAFGACTTSVSVGTKRGGVRGGSDISSLSAPGRGA